MGSEQTKRLKAGYRTAGILLAVGFACIGLTRLEDRGIIGPPGSAANAMVALNDAPEIEPEVDGYAGPPEDVVTINRARRAPGGRIRRVIADRDVPSVAARQILGPPPMTGGLGGDNIPASEPGAAEQILAPLTPSAPAFASLSPGLAGAGTPVFAAGLVPATGGGGTGGGGGGGNTGGGDNNGGGSTGGGGQTPVTPVPEPAAWLCLMLGLFSVGAAMRRASAIRFAVS